MPVMSYDEGTKLIMLPEDPRERYTPFRWLRYKLTGSPLKSYEKRNKEMWEDYMKGRDGMDLGFSRIILLKHYQRLEEKYD